MPHRLEDWFGSLTMPRQLVRQQCDNHFFRGHEDWLTKTVFTFLDPTGGMTHETSAANTFGEHGRDG